MEDAEAQMPSYQWRRINHDRLDIPLWVRPLVPIAGSITDIQGEKDIANLQKLNWMHRVWVMQEATVSEQITVICGKYSTNWDTIVRAHTVSDAGWDRNSQISFSMHRHSETLTTSHLPVSYQMPWVPGNRRERLYLWDLRAFRLRLYFVKEDRAGLFCKSPRSVPQSDTDHTKKHTGRQHYSLGQQGLVKKTPQLVVAFLLRGRSPLCRLGASGKGKPTSDDGFIVQNCVS
jgi:hypothetical protein